MSVHFGVVGVCEGKGIESVIDACGVEGGGLFAGGGGIAVELAEVKAFRFLDGGFVVFRCGAGFFFFGGEEGVFFSLLASCFCFLGFCLLGLLIRFGAFAPFCVFSCCYLGIGGCGFSVGCVGFLVVKLVIC